MKFITFSFIPDSVYLDHAGATLYAKSQLDAAFHELKGNLFSNPHSRSPASSFTTDAIDNVRQRSLKLIVNCQFIIVSN